MELLDLIQLADSAQDVMALLQTYVATLSDAAALPQWWLQLPLDHPDHARRRLAGLVTIVNISSRQLDARRCAAGKQALHVFAFGVWKLAACAAGRWPAHAAGTPAKQARDAATPGRPGQLPTAAVSKGHTP